MDDQVKETFETKENSSSDSRKNPEEMLTGSPLQTKKRPNANPMPIEPPPAKQACPTHPPKKYIYGNYDRYYGYRNPKDFHDIRLDTFKAQTESLFRDADVLDIGCNNGLVTIAVARDLGCRSATGIDIDKTLIGRARQQLAIERRRQSTITCPHTYPMNVSFMHGNYVLGDVKLLELEQPKFDTILCLSISKWIHLNFGDAGMKLAFRRMFRQLRPGGKLVLEAQDWKSYKRRKKLTEAIAEHFKAIRMQPQLFEAFLLGPEVGFERCHTLETPSHEARGFRRPIKVYVKATGADLFVESSLDKITTDTN